MDINWADYAALLSRYLRPQAARVVVLGGILLVGTGLQLAVPFLMRAFIDDARGGAPLAALCTLAWFYIAGCILDQTCNAAGAYLGADIGWIATNTLRADLARHCLSLDMPFFHTTTPGEMIERLEGDVNSINNFFGSFLVTVAKKLLVLVGVLVALFVIDWRLGLAFTLFSAVSLLVLVRSRSVAVPIMKQEREAYATVMGYVEERLGGLDDIRANGIGAYAMHGFTLVGREMYRIASKAWVMRNFMWILTNGSFVLGTLTTLTLSTLLFAKQIITLGTVYLIITYNSKLREPLEQLTRQMQELQQAGAGMLRIRELQAKTTSIVDGSGPSLPDGPLSVAFDDVTFSYFDEEPVLQDVRFTLAPGRILGVLGRTGSGKTTMMRLLFRLYDVQQGRVRVGERDVHDVTVADLRRRIGMVTQDVQLFHATVRDNLTFFDRRIPDARILEVIGELGLQEWFDKLPDGLDTTLQVGGSGLSAGESQLLAFTRIFLEDPGLILLDEPSSRLDPATERLIERAVERLLRGRTCIIIAHRLGTVRRADEILILDDGRVIEHGPRAALADNPASHFAGLLATGLEQELV
jgi:ABC-type multidrug transport system fused ATPase/permease subunit